MKLWSCRSRGNVQRTTRAAALLILLALLGGCGKLPQGNAQTSPTGSTLPFTILSHVGPRYLGAYPNLFAAPSLLDLEALVFAVGTNPNLEDCRGSRAPIMKSQCWLDMKDPGNSMLIAAYVDLPCSQSDLSATLSAPNEVTLTVTDYAGPFPPGFLASSAPSPKPGDCPKSMPSPAMLSLLAIPITSLPADELTIKLVHPLADVAVGRTMVDMKSPLHISGGALDAQIAVAQTALSLASADALKRVSPGQSTRFLLFGTGRWPDTSLGCPVSGQNYNAVESTGYIVLLKPTDQPSKVMEYHISGSLATFCGLQPSSS